MAVVNLQITGRAGLIWGWRIGIPSKHSLKNILKGFTKQNLFTIFKSNKNKNRKKIFIYNIKGNKMNKNFNIEIVAFAAERIAVFAERVFAIDNSVHRFK